MENETFDIVCLTEHWMTTSSLETVKILNYKLGSYFCRSVGKHGGVSIFVKNGLKFKERSCKNMAEEFVSEFCAIELTEYKIIIITVYRSCSADFNAFLRNFEQILNEFCILYMKIIILGDFNINFFTRSNNLTDFVCLLNSFNLDITIDTPTRVTDHSSTCIDNILTNLSNNDYEVSVLDPLLSDHYGQTILVSKFNSKPAPIWKRKINYRLLEKFRKTMIEINWQKYIYDNNVNTFAQNLLNTLQNVSQKSFPLRLISTEEKQPVKWFNNALRKMRNTLNAFKTICDCKNCPESRQAYKTFHKLYRENIARSKNIAYNNYILNSENVMKSSWKIINHETNRNKSLNELSEISKEKFSDYFCKVAENITKGIIHFGAPSNCSSSYSSSMFLAPFTLSEMSEAIYSLKKSHCMDYFDLNLEIILSVSDYLQDPLLLLFNNCVAHGIFPDCFKVSKIIPIFKKGDKQSVENYRPISIIPVVAKIFEKLVKKRLIDYLESYKIINSNQYGFRKNKSTIDALIRIVNDIVDGLEMGGHVALILCDLSKAFDCVDHNTLLNKLENIGIRGVPLALFQSYLSNRLQSVYINCEYSDLEVSKYGVPQGSVLGPVLFTIYVNDFFQFIHPERAYMFADDTSIVKFSKHIDILMDKSECIINTASNWFSVNNLSLNKEKTRIITFTNNQAILKGDSSKVLGLTLDENLSWLNHINNITSKLAKHLYIFRRLKSILHLEALKTAYFGLFHSVLVYGVVLWGNSAHAHKAFGVQKKVIRIICSAKYNEHCKPLFKQLQIMPLPSLYIYKTLLEIHKNKNNYRTHSHLHNYPTRSANEIVIPFRRLTKSIRNSLDINLYNHLPPDLKQLNQYSFKGNIKNFILQNCFYSSQEYIETCYSNLL